MDSTAPIPDGFRIGHATLPEAKTGCTAVICENGATGGVRIPGPAPAVRETEGLKPGCLTQTAHGLLLTGGSAYGLAAAQGLQAFLEEEGIGFRTGRYRVPIVPGAAIYDLHLGDGAIRPGPAEGREAGERAEPEGPKTGTVGGGTGATAGKIVDPSNARPSGIGTASLSLKSGVRVGALAIVNVLGDIVDPDTGDVLAGGKYLEDGRFWTGMDEVLDLEPEDRLGFPHNTLVGAVLTDARLNCEQATRLAGGGYRGVTHCVRPAATRSDGDVIFGLASGKQETSPHPDALVAGATRVMEQAITRLFRG